MASDETPADRSENARSYPGRTFRVFWTVASAFTVEVVIFALAAVPPAVAWTEVFARIPDALHLRLAVFVATLFPSYTVFTLGLMVYSAGASRLLGWRARDGLEMEIAEVGRPLMDFVRGAVLHHLVRIFAGTLYRVSPVWTFYLRLNGASVGKRVYVNTVSIADCPLLEIGEGSVIGSDVHIGGHWAEEGMIRTARVRLGRQVMIGNGSVIGIGAVIEDGVQVGALTVVPKYAHLEAGGRYVGAPAHRLEASESPDG